MNDWLIAAGYIVAWLLGIWVGWYGLRPPQLRWPWHYSEADAYTKKYCSDELALASEQARESEGRTMGDKTEARPVGPRNLTWQEAEELRWKGRIADKANDLEQRVTALEKRTKRQANLIERLFLDKWEAATPSTDSLPGPTLEQRVKALERQIEMDGRVERHEAALYNVAIRLEKLEAATPSPPTASPTTDSPSDAVQETTGVWTPQSWQLDPRITPGGPVGFGSEFVDPEDAWT